MITSSLIVLVVFVAIAIHNVLDTLRPFKPFLPYNSSEKCKLHKGPVGAEDLVLTPHDWIITSNLDMIDFWVEKGVDVCSRDNTGGLWAFDFVHAPQRLEVKGLPNEVEACFMTHGLFLSETTSRLYVVSHHGTHSSIQVLLVAYDKEQNNIPTLTWIRSITSPLFRNMGLNDVVEGVNGSELYVTQFLPFDMPVHGQNNPSSLLERIQQMLVVPMLILGIKRSTVLRCVFTDSPKIPAMCSAATDQTFRGANGIAISTNRKTLYVNDLFTHSLVVMKRLNTGMLEQVETIPLKHAVDNIECKLSENGREEIWMGTMPDMMVIAMNEGKPAEQREEVPGGLSFVTKDPNTGKWGDQQVVYNHDGSILSQASFGMQHGNKIILGSPHSNGVLVCDAV